jgi:hypothetical protein
MSQFDRKAMFCGWNAESEHQSMAGVASWTALSARWRARQGLPLLHPLDVQYLTPHDFCNGSGYPLSPVVQRRLFREYVRAAIATVVEARMGRPRRGGLLSADIALVRSDGFVRQFGVQQRDYVYGREDMGPYEPRALAPVRPYGVPVASKRAGCFWLDGSVLGDEDDNGDESWIDGYPVCGGLVVGGADGTAF